MLQLLFSDIVPTVHLNTVDVCFETFRHEITVSAVVLLLSYYHYHVGTNTYVTVTIPTPMFLLKQSGFTEWWFFGARSTLNSEFNRENSLSF